MSNVGQTVEPPKIGDHFIDDQGRNLVIIEINPGDPRDRNIVGKVDGKPYACSTQVFEAIWKTKL